MNHSPELNQSEAEKQNRLAELRAKLTQIKEAGEPNLANTDINALTDEDLTIYRKLLEKTLDEQLEFLPWRRKVREETKLLNQSTDPMKLSDRANFVAYVANKLTINKYKHYLNAK